MDYIRFLCSVPGLNRKEISKLHTHCNATHGRPADLNSPSIAVSHLVGTQTITRTVTNVAGTETYVIQSRLAPAIAMEVSPSAMTLRSGASRKIMVTLTVRSLTGLYSFGEIVMKGNRGHTVRIPVVAMGYKR